MPINQGRALYLRQQQEPNVEVAQGLDSIPVLNAGALSFFPGRDNNNGRGSRGGRGDGRGGVRGGGRGGMGRGHN